jgi:hypothetical protein
MQAAIGDSSFGIDLSVLWFILLVAAFQSARGDNNGVRARTSSSAKKHSVKVTGQAEQGAQNVRRFEAKP